MSGRRWLISGTGTGVGKTTLGCALAAALRTRGLRVGVMKPAETGCSEEGGGLVAADAMMLRAAAASSLAPELICPYRYRSPLAPAAAAERDGLPAVNFGRLADSFEQIAAQSDCVLVEGAGGLAVPITWESNYADLALAFRLELILVVANRLGAINAAVLSLDYAASRAVATRGYVINDIDPPRSEAALTNSASLARLCRAPCLGTLGFEAPLPRALADALLL